MGGLRDREGNHAAVEGSLPLILNGDSFSRRRVAASSREQSHAFDPAVAMQRLERITSCGTDAVNSTSWFSLY